MNLINTLNQVDWTKLGPIHKQPLMRHVSSMRENTIQAVSNMLTANIDSGLTHAIGKHPHSVDCPFWKGGVTNHIKAT